MLFLKVRAEDGRCGGVDRVERQKKRRNVNRLGENRWAGHVASSLVATGVTIVVECGMEEWRSREAGHV